MISKKIIIASFVLVPLSVISFYFINNNDNDVAKESAGAIGLENEKKETVEVKNEESFRDYTFSDVQKASTKDNCLTVVDGKVYDLTPWINQHPGGASNILRLCGIDGTQYFKNKHGSDPGPISRLESFFVSELKK